MLIATHFICLLLGMGIAVGVILAIMWATVEEDE
jgi:hypothetical protein